MNRISRYILSTLIAPFFFGASTIVFLFLMQFLMNNLYKLVGKGISNMMIFQLVGLNLPWMSIIAFPMGILFATLMGFGNMAANSETTIIKASGGSLLRMMRPVIFVGILLSVFLFWFNDQILPETNHQSKILFSDMSRAKPALLLEPGQFSGDELEGFSILSRKIDTSRNILKGVTIYDNKNAITRNIISADSGKRRFSPNMHYLILDMWHGESHSFYPNTTKRYKLIQFKDYRIISTAYGFGFEKTTGEVSRGDREMKITDMRKIVNSAWTEKKTGDSAVKATIDDHLNYLLYGNIHNENTPNIPIFNNNTTREEALERALRRVQYFSSTFISNASVEQISEERIRKYTVEIQKKYSIPFACLLFVFIGCPLGILAKKGNFGFSAGISLAFYIFYWVCLIGGEKLADRGVLNAELSMWLGNILLAIIGLFLTLRVNNESLSFLIPRFLKK